MLDDRLKTCAEFVSGRGIACDVGTDHAYLAAELVRSGRCAKVIASDVKEGPLDSARKTVEKCGVADKVDVVLSDGLDDVDISGVTDVVIAGMGGENIIKILNNRPEAMEIPGIRLILQPMSKPEILRKWLYMYGMEITAEKAVEVDYKLYTVICAEKAAKGHLLTEFESIAGFFTADDELGKKYRRKESERLAKVAQSLDDNGRVMDAVHYSAMSRRLVERYDGYREDIRKIYKHLDYLYPFSLQEEWDNSGLLVENDSMTCSKIMLTLDITAVAIEEAAKKGMELMISHHPVIFDALNKIVNNDPAYKLVRNDIAAICMHTNLDIAEGGTNTAIVKKLAEKLEFDGPAQQFEELDGGNTLGYIVELRDKISAGNFSEILKDIFDLDMVKTNTYGEYSISKVAICSGSGGSMLDLAIAKNCDALITGDVKYNIWIEANNRYFTVFDCGHFHTESLVLPELRRVLEEKFPLLDIEIAESSVDPCEYY